jgi:hypothetical protein
MILKTNQGDNTMGEYWLPVNLDKEEFIEPHVLGAGLKLWEQVTAHPGTAAALIILVAGQKGCASGNLDLKANWHGQDRLDAMASGDLDGITPAPMPEEYKPEQIIGRWAGDRIMIVGDYTNVDLYNKCRNGEFLDISEEVCRVIEHELCGKFTGDGWRKWETNDGR